MPEVVVIPHYECFDAQFSDQVAADEIGGTRPAEFAGKRDDDQIVDAGPFEQPGLLVERREQAQIGLCFEYDARVGRECDDDTFAVAFAGEAAHGREQLAVTAVYAVERSDSSRRMAECGEPVDSVENFHRASVQSSVGFSSFSLTK